MSRASKGIAKALVDTIWSSPLNLMGSNQINNWICRDSTRWHAIVEMSIQPVGLKQTGLVKHPATHVPRSSNKSPNLRWPRGGLKLAPTTNHAPLRTCAFESSFDDITRFSKIARRWIQE